MLGPLMRRWGPAVGLVLVILGMAASLAALLGRLNPVVGLVLVLGGALVTTLTRPTR